MPELVQPEPREHGPEGADDDGVVVGLLEPAGIDPPQRERALGFGVMSHHFSRVRSTR